MPPRPHSAKSDAATVMHLDDVEKLLTQVEQLADLRKTWER